MNLVCIHLVLSRLGSVPIEFRQQMDSKNLGTAAATVKRSKQSLQPTQPLGLRPAAKSTSLLQVAGSLILCLVRPVKTTLRSMFVALILSTMLLSSGCEKKTAATDPTAQSTPGSTKPLEAADLVGYDGKRLRKSVDHIKEANEKHNQDVEKMAGSGPDQ